MKRLAKKILQPLLGLAGRVFGTITSVRTEEPMVALTFDDGPHPASTPRLLELLESHDARGTFFMVGKAAAQHGDIVKRVAQGGHEIGNHTWDHTALPLHKSFWRRMQLRWCQEALAPFGSGLFRPPYGSQSIGTYYDAVRLGLTPVTWNVAAEDWGDDSADMLVERVSRELASGAIVLFHDALYTADEERFRDRTAMLNAVERILTDFGSSYRFVTVRDLLAHGRPVKVLWRQPAPVESLRMTVLAHSEPAPDRRRRAS